MNKQFRICRAGRFAFSSLGGLTTGVTTPSSNEIPGDWRRFPSAWRGRLRPRGRDRFLHRIRDRGRNGFRQNRRAFCRSGRVHSTAIDAIPYCIWIGFMVVVMLASLSLGLNREVWSDPMRLAQRPPPRISRHIAAIGVSGVSSQKSAQRIRNARRS